MQGQEKGPIFLRGREEPSAFPGEAGDAGQAPPADTRTQQRFRRTLTARN